MKKKKALYLIVVTIIVSGLLFTGCHPHRSPDPDRIGHKLDKHVEHILNSIDATDKQKASINTITSEIRQDVAVMYRNNSFEHQDLLQTLFSDHPDATRLHHMLDAKSEQMNAFGHRTLDRLLEINGLLTPEQRRVLKQKYQKFHNKTR